MPSKRESTSMFACVEDDWVRLARSHCELRQTDSFRADTFKIPDASMSKSEFNLRTESHRDGTSQAIVILSHRTLPFEDLDENTRLVVSVRHSGVQATTCYCS